MLQIAESGFSICFVMFDNGRYLKLDSLQVKSNDSILYHRLDLNQSFDACQHLNSISEKSK